MVTIRYNTVTYIKKNSPAIRIFALCNIKLGQNALDLVPEPKNRVMTFSEDMLFWPTSVKASYLATGASGASYGPNQVPNSGKNACWLLVVQDHLLVSL